MTDILPIGEKIVEKSLVSAGLCFSGQRSPSFHLGVPFVSILVFVAASLFSLEIKEERSTLPIFPFQNTRFSN